MKRAERSLRYPLLGLAALGALLVFLVPIPCSLEVRGLVAPAARWELTRGADGQLVGSLVNFVTGRNEGYSVAQFSRGDAVHVALSPALTASGRVGIGDTVALIHSTEAEERLAELSGELAVAQATLASASAGQKDALVQAAEQRLSRALAEAGQQHRELDREKDLFEQGIETAQGYEAAETATELADLEVSVARSELEVARTGDKPEQIRLYRSQVDGLSQQIQALEQRFASYAITSPLDGMVSRSLSPDTLLVVSDTRSLVLLMPVGWEGYETASGATQVSVNLPGSRASVVGRLVSLEREIRFTSGAPAVLATALLEDAPVELVPGMPARCAIHCGSATLFQRMRRTWALKGT